MASSEEAPANERAWLTHELGHCYLKVKETGKARWCGELSYRAATKAEDKQSQLNANILIAQAIRE